jgi:hypothetical protein
MLVPSSEFIPHAPSSVGPFVRTIAKVKPGISFASTASWIVFTKSGVRIVCPVVDGSGEVDRCHPPAIPPVALWRRTVIGRRKENLMALIGGDALV